MQVNHRRRSDWLSMTCLSWIHAGWSWSPGWSCTWCVISLKKICSITFPGGQSGKPVLSWILLMIFLVDRCNISKCPIIWYLSVHQTHPASWRGKSGLFWWADTSKAFYLPFSSMSLISSCAFPFFHPRTFFSSSVHNTPTHSQHCAPFHFGVA